MLENAEPEGGSVSATITSSKLWIRKYTGKTRFCKLVNADCGRDWKAISFMTKVWYISVPSNVEYASRWNGAIAAAIIDAEGIFKELRGPIESRIFRRSD